MRHQKLLKRYCSEVYKAFSENKLSIYISIAILLISLLLGYFLEDYLYSYFNPVVNNLNHKVSSGVIKLTYMTIFTNNMRIIIQMFIYGIFFCLSAFILAFNGFFIGYYVALQNNFFKTAILMIPHGIFELPSSILACASGLILFNFIFRIFKSFWNDNSFKNSVLSNLDKLKQSLIIFSVSVILMIIACFVEVYLTVPIAKFILG